MEVPGDISSAAFFIVAASLLKGSKIRLGRVSVNPTRSGIINVMSRMGARIRILNRVESFEPYADIEVSFARTGGVVVREEEIPLIIDELPAIFVLSALSKGRTVIKGAGELKLKETDRIRSMQENLRAMGARFDTVKQDIVIRGVPSLKGARLKSFGDHRTCMAMTVASLAASGASVIDDAACVGKSFPGFFDALEGLK
jgi:3-phosphoshikimate 1-carboxyvinyltransferase